MTSQSIIDTVSSMSSILNRQPGRPRQFDTKEVLKIVQNLFWEKGYKATSLADLINATGLHKGSLYRAFGGKKELYLLSLENYMNDMFNETIAIASQHSSPLAALQSILFHIIDTAENDNSCSKGCMIVNSVVQLSEEDNDLQILIKHYYEKRFNALTELIKQGQTMCEIKTTTAAPLQALMIMTFMSGLATTMKSQLYFAPKKQLNARDQVDTFIQSVIKA